MCTFLLCLKYTVVFYGDSQINQLMCKHNGMSFMKLNTDVNLSRGTL
jgi:hypothetical protein